MTKCVFVILVLLDPRSERMSSKAMNKNNASIFNDRTKAGVEETYSKVASCGSTNKERPLV